MEADLSSIADYYSAKLAEHGPGPHGVDWKDAPGQELRFTQLLRVAEGSDGSSSIDDYGCGYGALLDRLARERPKADYLGLDLSEPMIAQARRRHPGEAARFHLGARSPRVADFAVASGIFNVRLKWDPAGWERHIFATLDGMHEASRLGFAFNCLTCHSDPPRMRNDLYYGDPCFYFEHCRRRYSRHVAVFHDYGLYEFTLVVRKPAP